MATAPSLKYHLHELIKYMATISDKTITPTPQTMVWFTFLFERIWKYGDCVEGMNRLWAAPPLPGDFNIPVEERCRVAWNLLLFRVYALANLLATLVPCLQLPLVLKLIDRIPFPERERLTQACRLLLCESDIFTRSFPFQWMDGITPMPWLFSVEYQTGVAVGTNDRTGNDEAMALHSAVLVHFGCLTAIFSPWERSTTYPSCNFGLPGVAQEGLTTFLLRVDPDIRQALVTVTEALIHIVLSSADPLVDLPGGAILLEAYQFVRYHQLTQLQTLEHNMADEYRLFRGLDSSLTTLQNVEYCVMDIQSVARRELRYIKQFFGWAEPVLITALQVPLVQNLQQCPLGPVSLELSQERFALTNFTRCLQNKTRTEWVEPEVVLVIMTSAILLPLHDVASLYNWWYRPPPTGPRSYYYLSHALVFNLQSSDVLVRLLQRDPTFTLTNPPVALNVTPLGWVELAMTRSKECRGLFEDSMTQYLMEIDTFTKPTIGPWEDEERQVQIQDLLLQLAAGTD